MQKRIIKIVKKYKEYIYTKIKLIFVQKSFVYQDTKLHYIVTKAKDSHSKSLIVVFSSCTRNGIKARYNYMRTLGSINANKLFILDDFADDKRGSYYLGKGNDGCVEEGTLSLIKMVQKNLNITQTICCGSSKGGYSALNFGLQLEESIIIAGAPQYHLGTYLKESGNEACLKYIIGEETQERIDNLNSRLKQVINRVNDSKKHDIFLHYSDKEHTNFEHICDLINDLQGKDIKLACDIAEYSNHSDVALYFPDFLVRTLRSVL